MDYAARLQELDEEYAKKRAELQLESEIMSLLPAYTQNYKSMFVVYQLWNERASIKFQHDFYSLSTEEKQQPTLEFGAQLAADLPAEPCVLVKDGGMLRFMNKAWWESLPADHREKQHVTEVVDVCPVQVRLDAYQQPTAEISWQTVLADKLIGVDLVLPLSHQFGHVDVKYENYMGGRRVKYCECRPAANLETLFAEEQPVAKLATPIRWGRGSDDVPNQFTLYWTPLNTELVCGPAQLFQALQAERK